ncbi:MAG: DNA topoisomerase 3 [Paludibacteraceae bacterium]|nr:DNA topoisomerase 3 [Paludibacteraceae bacterium]
MKVIIAEKPSVAKDIAKVLRITGRKEGYLEGRGCQVTWAFGHLISLATPDHYGYKKWRIEDLPIIPERFDYLPNGDEGAQKQLAVIKRLFDEAEEIICATDAGREGEAIFRYIYEHCGCNKPFRRLWISSMTDQAILEGFHNLKDGREYDPLYASAKARNEADWLVGMNASRALTLTTDSRTPLSLGRVQTPTLAIICQRYLEHVQFEPKPFYTVNVLLDYQGNRFQARYPSRFDTQEKADALSGRIGDTVRTADKQKKQKTEKSPLPFDITSLQAEANKKYGFSAQKTLDIMQNLYERYKVLTYPRTGSRYLGDDMVDEIKSKIGQLQVLPMGDAFQQALQRLSANGINTACFDSKKLTDHHAIIPTFHGLDRIGQLPADERKIFDLATRQLVMALLTPCKKEVLAYKFLVDGEPEPLQAAGAKIMEPGWRLLAGADEKSETGNGEEDDDSQELPDIPKHAAVDVVGKETKEGYTKKPPLLTEATLLKNMETAGRQLDDPEAVEAMKDCGLGTPATRAAVIETLYTRKYIVNEKKKLIPTPLGLSVYQLVKDAAIGNPAMTGEWEKKLNLMATSQYAASDFNDEIVRFTQAEVSRLLQEGGQVRTGQISDLRCPLCGHRLRENAKAYGCSDTQNHCPFVIWKEIGGTTITQELVEEIVTRGYSRKLTGLKGKSGKPFDAHIGYDPQTGKPRYLFRPALAQCPLCGKDIVEGNRGYGCMGFQSGCHFVVWKETAGRSISIEEMQILIKDGRTPVLDGFKSDDGTGFRASLVLQKDGTVQVEPAMPETAEPPVSE